MAGRRWLLVQYLVSDLGLSPTQAPGNIMSRRSFDGSSISRADAQLGRGDRAGLAYLYGGGSCSSR